MKIKVKLKRATKEDLLLIQRLLEENELPYEDIPEKLGFLFLGFSGLESGHTGSKFIGLGGIEIYGNSGLLRSVVIDEALRGQGYGKALCLKLLEHAKSKGIKELYLLTTTAENFFQKLGFEKVDRKLAPEAIKRTSEFSELCPESAVCMRLRVV